MKKLLVLATCFLFFTALAPSSSAADLKVSFTDSTWSGSTVPDKGICKHRGGEGWSPALRISNIPDGAVKVELRFTDEDWDFEGFHGVVAVKVPAGGKSVDVPSFESETDTLPAGIESIRAHGCFQCGGGAYLGPCSGGRNHTYTVYVYAMNAKGETLAKGELSLGSY